MPWPAVRQLTGPDRTGRGEAARSRATDLVQPRVATADRIVKSVCPYCAVGCGQRVYVENGPAGRWMRAGQVLTVAGLALAFAGRRRRVVSAAGGVALAAASACTRFGIFEAGMASARDPRDTIEPQRRRAVTT